MPLRPVPFNSLGQIITSGAVQQSALRLQAGKQVADVTGYLAKKYPGIPDSAIKQVLQYAAEGIASAKGAFANTPLANDSPAQQAIETYLRDNIGISPELADALRDVVSADYVPLSIADILRDFPGLIPTVEGITGSEEKSDRISMITSVENIDTGNAVPVFATLAGYETIDGIEEFYANMTVGDDATSARLAKYLAAVTSNIVTVTPLALWKEW